MAIENPSVVPTDMTNPRRVNVGPSAQLPGENKGNLAETVTTLDLTNPRLANIEPPAQLTREIRGNLAEVVTPIVVPDMTDPRRVNVGPSAIRRSI
jgi:hypothetical protein